MRTVQFRARCAISRVWRYGYYYPSKGNHIIRNEKDAESIILIGTLGENTGLKDKNGKEIYEGDIVNYAEKKAFCKNNKCENQNYLGIEKFCPSCGAKISQEDFVTKSEIRFMEGAFVYYKKPSEDTYQAWNVNIAEIYIEWVEIIGNIYEHKHLLK